MNGIDWPPTQKILVEVQLRDGASLAGSLHLAGSVPHRVGPETPLEFLNRPEPFFAFQPATGGVFFVARAQVRMVTVRGMAVEPSSTARSVEIELTLAGGETLAGTCTIELPPPRNRTLDYLNQPEPFLALVARGATHYIPRAAIRRVRPVSD